MSENRTLPFDTKTMLPFAKDSETSRKAALSIYDEQDTIRRFTFDVIRWAGEQGATCDEVEMRTGLRHQTISARIYELKKRGHIALAGKRRATRSGRQAEVYVISDYAKENAPHE